MFDDNNNILTGIQKIKEWPFPHAVVANCLPQYEELSANRPPWQAIAGYKAGENNKRSHVSAKHALDSSLTPAIWKEFIAYHVSADFYKQIIGRFRPFIEQFYPHLTLDKYKPGMRFGEKADIYLDCQIGINTPVTAKSTVSTPHIDNFRELWAAMLYMREPDDNAGGDLVLHKCTAFPKVDEKRQVSSGTIPHTTIPYEANTMACFMNSPFSIHAVTEREVTGKPRWIVNFVLEFVP